MASLRLNGVIRALEGGKTACLTFVSVDTDAALAMATSRYEGVIFEAEHRPWDARALRDSLQYLLDRKSIVHSASVAPTVTPIVRVPANGAEMNQWLAKQALDVGAYGIVWPHISTAEEAANAVGSCRYPRPKERPDQAPAGLRGFGPTAAARYWGLARDDYCRRADVWPLASDGEILVVLMIEDSVGIGNLPDILKQVPGIGAILIGLADLSQELGHPNETDHPSVRAAVADIVAICKEHDIVVGHPLVDVANAARIIDEGYRLLVCPTSPSFAALDEARRVASRARQTRH